ncbi:hypothetical protein [Photorhabdus sp. RM71S]|uniref:hypothetical protein n=1 Tax=Photorhabdus sp. RM71S TaxID=3342824 RepID=UPI0036DBF31F
MKKKIAIGARLSPTCFTDKKGQPFTFNQLSAFSSHTFFTAPFFSLFPTGG